jgi:hypothetical protein
MSLCILFMESTYPELGDLHEGLQVTVMESKTL